FGGRVVDELTQAPVANANVFVIHDGDDPKSPQARILDHIQTDARGAFLARLAPGKYQYIIVADDRLTTDPVGFTVTAREQTGVLAQIKPPGALVVATLDELGRHAPAKIQLVGHFDASHQSANPPPDGRTFLYSLKLGEHTRPTAFDAGNRFIEGSWWT